MSAITKSVDELSKELMVLVAEEGMVDADNLQPEALLEDLDINSADFVMILMAIEEEYGAYISVDNELSDVKTVQDLLDFAIGKIQDHQLEAAE